MYGASLTKTVFAYTVMQLVDPGKLNLDTPPSIGAAPNSSGEFG
jgi:CubicO group peptidase (beta-lactamase class C family)